MKKFLALALVLVMCMSVALADGIYSTFSSHLVDAVGWWFCYDTTLLLDQDAGTYTLMYKANIFGTTDPGIKGIKTIIYKGTCTVAPSADGEVAHLDVTIDTVDSVVMEQHEKAWGRQVLNYAMVLDSECWTDDMEDIYGDDCAAWVENHQAPLGAVITVEDLALDFDDVTLVNRIVCGLEGINLDIAE